MVQNFYFAFLALARDIKIEVSTLFTNKLFIGFLFGFIIAIFILALIVSENPRHIPILLRYDQCKSFEKIHKLNTKFQYDQSFCSFVKKYHTVRTSFYLVVLFFSLALIGSLFIQNFETGSL